VRIEPVTVTVTDPIVTGPIVTVTGPIVTATGPIEIVSDRTGPFAAVAIDLKCPADSARD
jgi:hypothetical protein